MRAWNRKHKPKHWTRPKWHFDRYLVSKRIKGKVCIFRSRSEKVRYCKNEIIIVKPIRIKEYNC